MSLPSTIFPKRVLEVVSARPLDQEGAAAPRARLQSKASLPSRIAVIGNYLPRHCGIATFTTDLCCAISAEYGTARLLALPVNDTEEGYDYPARVGVPLDAALAESLLKLMLVGPYNRAADWVFASPTIKGKQPLWPETLW